MGIKDKIANAKTTDWLTKDVSDLKLKRIKYASRVFAIIKLGVKKITDLLFGKKYNIDAAREEMVKEFRKNPMTFSNSNYRPSSFSLKIDSFMMGVDDWRNNHRR